MAILQDRMKWAIMGYFDESQTAINANIKTNRHEMLGRCADGAGFLAEVINCFNHSRAHKSNMLRLCVSYCVCARALLLCAIDGITEIKTALIEANTLCEKALSILCDFD